MWGVLGGGGQGGEEEVFLPGVQALDTQSQPCIRDGSQHPAIALPDVFPKELEAGTRTQATCTAVSFTVAKRWGKSKCPSKGRTDKHVAYTHPGTLFGLKKQ